MSTETTREAATRFEVIDGRADAAEPGRTLVAYGVQVELSRQDGGRTLKVFLSDRPLPELREEDIAVTVTDNHAASREMHWCTVRATHLPTGIIATAEGQSSQIAVKAAARRDLQKLVALSQYGDGQDAKGGAMSTPLSAVSAGTPETGATFVMVCRTCGQPYGEPVYLEWAGRVGDVVLPPEPDGNCPACS